MNAQGLIETDKLINIWLEKYKTTEESNVKAQIKNLITLTYLPLVKKISHGLARRSNDPIEDLIQVGSVGLLKAIEQYNSEFDAKFKTYATYLITGEIRHYLRDKSSMIKAPRELQELAFRVNQIVQKLTAKLGASPTDLQIAEELQIPIGKINEITDVDRRKQHLSLDQVISKSSEGEQVLVDKLVDDKYQEYQMAQEDRIMLNEAIDMLEEPLKQVIKMSFFEDMSQSEISKKLGVSQMQISRRIRKALNELLKIIGDKKAEYVA